MQAFKPPHWKEMCACLEKKEKEEEEGEERSKEMKNNNVTPVSNLNYVLYVFKRYCYYLAHMLA